LVNALEVYEIMSENVNLLTNDQDGEWWIWYSW
jgi:hypothetical protein